MLDGPYRNRRLALFQATALVLFGIPVVAVAVTAVGYVVAALAGALGAGR